MYQNPTPYPSVTQVLSPFCDWSRIPAKILEAAAIRGTRIHDAISDDLTGGFVVLPDELMGYYASFKKWSCSMLVEAVEVEKRYVNTTFGFTGQIDCIARLSGDTGLTLIDWKTGATAMPSWRIQIAAYRELAAANGIETVRGLSVRVRGDGSGCVVKEYPGNCKQDYAVFLSALTAYNFFKPKTIDWEAL